MPDRYQQFTATGPGKALVKRLGLPTPAPLRRHRPGDPPLPGPALLDAAPGGRLREATAGVLAAAGVEVLVGVPAEAGERRGLGALVFDASGITGPAGLRALYDFFHPVARSLAPGGRAVVLGTPPERAGGAHEAVAQRALEGFVRSLGKELRGGSTAQLVLVDPGAETKTASTLRFLLSARSAYVSGQVVRVGAHGGSAPEPADWAKPLADRTVVVTGASRGIGAAIAEVLARDGATVVALDVPAQGGELAAVANRVGGTAVQLDITADDAPQRLARHLATRFGSVDAVVHNAGVTRDKTLANMADSAWDAVLAVNLAAPLRLTDALLGSGVLGAGGRVVGVSSIAGIAGNTGQTNYAASKAGA